MASYTRTLRYTLDALLTLVRLMLKGLADHRITLREAAEANWEFGGTYSLFGKPIDRYLKTVLQSIWFLALLVYYC